MTDKLNHFQFRALRVLSLLGILVTAYLVYQHYKLAGGSFCDISDYVNCDIVNKSIYSEIFGVPVAALGFFTYLVFFITTFPFLKKMLHMTVPLLALFATLALLFSFYLTYIEFFILRAVCILCITQQILMLLIFLIFLSLWHEYRKRLFFWRP